jgi:hypothetical protein
MSDRLYQVRVLVSDGKPGNIPFTWHLNAESRDQAISVVRKRTRMRGMVVKHIDYAKQVSPPQVP